MKLGLLALVSALVVSGTASADYDCEIKRVFTIEKDGDQAKSSYEDVYLGYTLRYDDLAGTIEVCRQGDCRRGWSEMEIVQQPSSENSLIALQVSTGMSTAIGLLRIWVFEKGMPFLYLDNGAEVWAVGSCNTKARL